MKRMVLAYLASVALSVGSASASALPVADRAHDDRACTRQTSSPSCNTTGVPGGIESNHNETLVLGA